ncbi:hypothetical protein GJ496_001369 [Pomphorhynchus laevis]|nr:hypothetical protein GJ496_001369 [Pomphorhynchus laevis]
MYKVYLRFPSSVITSSVKEFRIALDVYRNLGSVTLYIVVRESRQFVNPNRNSFSFRRANSFTSLGCKQSNKCKAAKVLKKANSDFKKVVKSSKTAVKKLNEKAVYVKDKYTIRSVKKIQEANNGIFTLEDQSANPLEKNSDEYVNRSSFYANIYPSNINRCCEVGCLSVLPTTECNVQRNTSTSSAVLNTDNNNKPDRRHMQDRTDSLASAMALVVNKKAAEFASKITNIRCENVVTPSLQQNVDMSHYNDTSLEDTGELLQEMLIAQLDSFPLKESDNDPHDDDNGIIYYPGKLLLQMEEKATDDIESQLAVEVQTESIATLLNYLCSAVDKTNEPKHCCLAIDNDQTDQYHHKTDNIENDEILYFSTKKIGDNMNESEKSDYGHAPADDCCPSISPPLCYNKFGITECIYTGGSTQESSRTTSPIELTIESNSLSSSISFRPTNQIDNSNDKDNNLASVSDVDSSLPSQFIKVNQENDYVFIDQVSDEEDIRPGNEDLYFSNLVTDATIAKKDVNNSARDRKLPKTSGDNQNSKDINFEDPLLKGFQVALELLSKDKSRQKEETIIGKSTLQPITRSKSEDISLDPIVQRALKRLDQKMQKVIRPDNTRLVDSYTDPLSRRCSIDNLGSTMRLRRSNTPNIKHTPLNGNVNTNILDSSKLLSSQANQNFNSEVAESSTLTLNIDHSSKIQEVKLDEKSNNPDNKEMYTATLIRPVVRRNNTEISTSILPFRSNHVTEPNSETIDYNATEDLQQQPLDLRCMPNKKLNDNLQDRVNAHWKNSLNRLSTGFLSSLPSSSSSSTDERSYCSIPVTSLHNYSTLPKFIRNNQGYSSSVEINEKLPKSRVINHSYGNIPPMVPPYLPSTDFYDWKLPQSADTTVINGSNNNYTSIHANNIPKFESSFKITSRRPLHSIEKLSVFSEPANIAKSPTPVKSSFISKQYMELPTEYGLNHSGFYRPSSQQRSNYTSPSRQHQSSDYYTPTSQQPFNYYSSASTQSSLADRYTPSSESYPNYVGGYSSNRRDISMNITDPIARKALERFDSYTGSASVGNGTTPQLRSSGFQPSRLLTSPSFDNIRDSSTSRMSEHKFRNNPQPLPLTTRSPSLTSNYRSGLHFKNLMSHIDDDSLEIGNRFQQQRELSDDLLFTQPKVNQKKQQPLQRRLSKTLETDDILQQSSTSTSAISSDIPKNNMMKKFETNSIHQLRHIFDFLEKRDFKINHAHSTLRQTPTRKYMSYSREYTKPMSSNIPTNVISSRHESQSPFATNSLPPKPIKPVEDSIESDHKRLPLTIDSSSLTSTFPHNNRLRSSSSYSNIYVPDINTYSPTNENDIPDSHTVTLSGRSTPGNIYQLDEPFCTSSTNDNDRKFSENRSTSVGAADRKRSNEISRNNLIIDDDRTNSNLNLKESLHGSQNVDSNFQNQSSSLQTLVADGITARGRKVDTQGKSLNASTSNRTLYKTNRRNLSKSNTSKNAENDQGNRHTDRSGAQSLSVFERLYNSGNRR